MSYCEEFFSNVSRNKSAHLVAFLVYFNLHIHNQFHTQAFSSIGNLIAYVVAFFGWREVFFEKTGVIKMYGIGSLFFCDFKKNLRFRQIL